MNGTILELIRYGLPGYLFLMTLSLELSKIGIVPKTPAFYEQYGSILSLVLVVAGPIVGFVIHQIYFLWFESRESYVSLNRMCLKTLYSAYIWRNKSPIEEHKDIRSKCYLVWKYIMTGVLGTVATSEIILKRLSNLRFYEHAFGAILCSCYLSLAIMFVFNSYIAIAYDSVFSSVDAWCVAVILALSALFHVQRSRLAQRIEEIENGMMQVHIDHFCDGLSELLEIHRSLENQQASD